MTDALEEAKYWTEQLNQAKRSGQLDAVQRAATSWTALFSAFFGLFATVAFAGGLRSIDEIGNPGPILVKSATTLGVILLGGATFLSARASGRLFPSSSTNTTWQELRRHTIEGADQAYSDLRYARILGSAAAAVVLLGSAAVLWAPSKEPAPTRVIIQETTGEARCGELGKLGDGGLTVGGTPLDQPDTKLWIVERCP